MVDVNKVYIFSAFLRSSYFLRFFQKPIILSVIFLFCFVLFVFSLTATTSLFRGSQTRSRLSLQVVQNKLPLRFQLML